MIYCSDNFSAMKCICCYFSYFFNVQKAGSFGACFTVYSLFYRACEHTDVTLTFAVKCRFNSPAAVVPEYHNEPAAEVLDRVFKASELGFGDDVAGDANDEQLADAAAENRLGDHP